MKNNESVLDSLFSSDGIEEIVKEQEALLPKKCSTCSIMVVCNVLPILVGFGRYGIKLAVEECPFSPKKDKT